MSHVGSHAAGYKSERFGVGLGVDQGSYLAARYAGITTPLAITIHHGETGKPALERFLKKTLLLAHLYLRVPSAITPHLLSVLGGRSAREGGSAGGEQYLHSTMENSEHPTVDSGRVQRRCNP